MPETAAYQSHNMLLSRWRDILSAIFNTKDNLSLSLFISLHSGQTVTKKKCEVFLCVFACMLEPVGKPVTGSVRYLKALKDNVT